MVWQLRKALPKYFDLSFGDADPSNNLTLSSYEELLFLSPDPDTPTTLPKTDLQGDHLYDSVQFGEQTVTYPQPYIFGLRPLEAHPFHDRMHRLSRALCLYDNAGEHFMPGADKYATPVTRHLALSRVLLFLFDPTQDPEFRRACADSTSDPQMKDRARTYRQELVLLEAADRIRRHTGLSQSAQHPRPLVVIVTKFDAWRSLLGDLPPRLKLSSLVRNDGKLNALDLSAVEDMSRRVREVLVKYRGEFVSAAEGFCKEVLYVPVSALGRAPEVQPDTGALVIRPNDIKPMWTEVPLLYSLAKWVQGLVPFTRSHADEAGRPMTLPIHEINALEAKHGQMNPRKEASS
jgi:hypothetical protein